MTKMANKWVYAVYKGDKYITEGTREEICKYMNIKNATFNYYRTKHWIVNRYRGNHNRTIIIRIDGEDKMEKYFTNLK